MPAGSDPLQIVRELADGTFEWQGPLSLPGEGGPALLADFSVSDTVNATKFEITGSADWVAEVAGIAYNVIPGVIPKTGRFVFIGVPGKGGKAAVGNPDDVRAKFTSIGSLTAVVTDTVLALFNGLGALTATTEAVQPPGEYDDNFNRPDGGLGSWWTPVTEAIATAIVVHGGEKWSLFEPDASLTGIVDHELTTTVANKQQHAIWNNPLPATDHRLEVEIGSVVPDVTYLSVRVNQTGGHVRATFTKAGQVTLHSYEGDMVLGTATQRDDNPTGVPLVTGQVPSLEALGTRYVAYLDGVEVARWDDTTLAWDHVNDTHQQVAIGLLTAVAGVGSIDDFLAEDLSGARFSGDGALTATVTSTDLTQIKDARLAGTGVLLARARGFTRNPRITADFSGEGALSSPLRQPYADDFNRPDGPPGDQWTVWHDAGLADLFVLGNEMVTTNDANEQHGWWNLALPTPNHSVEITVGSAVAAEYFLLVRAASSGGVATTYVQARLFTTDGSVELNSKDVDLTRRASLASGPSLVTGQVIRFEAAGGGTARSKAGVDGLSAEVDGRASAAAEYVLYVDDVEILRWSDTAVAWDHVDDLHLNVDVAMQGTGSLDNFKATDLDVATYDFSGSGTLTATATATALMGEFDFHEGSGPTATSVVSAHTLTATDPATAWQGEAAAGEFVGVVGTGILDDWTAEFTVTLNAYPSAGATPELEGFVAGADRTYLMVGSAGYLGINCEGQRPWGNVSISQGVPHTVIWGQRSAGMGKAGGTLEAYVDGELMVSCPTTTGRDFAGEAALLRGGGLDPVMDDAVYRNVAIAKPPVAIDVNFSGGGTFTDPLLSAPPHVPEEYSDDFNRSDGDPGPGWELANALVANELVIIDNELAVVGSDELGARFAVWVNPLPDNDQKVEVRVGSDVPSAYILTLRTSMDDGHVRAQFNPDTPSANISAYEGDFIMGSTTPGSPVATPAMPPGTILGFEAVGNEYVMYVGGVEVKRETLSWDHVDTQHRRVGVGIQTLPVVYGGPDTGSLDDFNATPPPPPPFNPDDYSDVFNRADGPPGDSWEMWHVGGTMGLPEAIRTDNGVPFASAHALYGLSKLAVWWLRLGIGLERIAPGHPEQNGRHERLHLTLKTEATRPPSTNVLQQQARFDTFVHQFNHERPHQALDMATPASRYQPSARAYQGLEELEYPHHDWTAIITTCGRICYQRRKVNVSQVFAGQKVGVRQTDDHIWLVTFMDYDLGYFDDETCRLEPIDNPFGSKLLPMSPE